jgi:hypothetical protein
MTIIKLNKKEIDYVLSLAKKRHDAKPNNIKNSGILIDRDISNPLENYLPHFIGLVGEYAWAKYTKREVDENIYTIRDNEDFNGEEVKTITYYGDGEPELKVKLKEYENKKPNKYILARTDKIKILKALNSNTQKSIDIELLGEISRENFDHNKVKKRYGMNNPMNYVVSLSKMNEL